MNTASGVDQGRRRSPAPWLCLFGVLAWTWTWLAVAASTGRPVFSVPTVALVLIGGLGPLVVPAVLIRFGFWDSTLDPSVGAFLRRAYDPTSISRRWYAYIAGIIVLVALGPVLVDRWGSGGAGAGSGALISVGSAGMLLMGILGGVLEEPGWRGYAQEGLQRRMSVLQASLVVGVFWGLWHLPLFGIEGTYQAGLGWGTPEFWSFHLAIVAACPLYAWLYNVAGGASEGPSGLAGRATFAAVFYHAGTNIGRQLVPDVSNLAEVGVEAMLSLVVVAGAWSWMRKKRGPDRPGRDPDADRGPATDSASNSP